jgi:hypothetical protein
METPDVTVGELLKLLGEKVVELYQLRVVIDRLNAKIKELEDGKLG